MVYTILCLVNLLDFRLRLFPSLLVLPRPLDLALGVRKLCVVSLESR